MTQAYTSPSGGLMLADYVEPAPAADAVQCVKISSTRTAAQTLTDDYVRVEPPGRKNGITYICLVRAPAGTETLCLIADKGVSDAPSPVETALTAPFSGVTITQTSASPVLKRFSIAPTQALWLKPPAGETIRVLFYPADTGPLA